jgi:NhaP-type Na+/H+ or K+/H+ antiporter
VCRFILAAVSPAVVVPSMLALITRGYGKDKGVPTLVMAASSVDDVLAITGFGVMLAMALSTGECVINLQV